MSKTIEEMKEAKRQLEAGILASVRLYELEYGVHVNRIELRETCGTGYVYMTSNIEVEVRL